MQNELLANLAALMNQHIATSDKFSDRDRINTGTAMVEDDAVILTGTFFRDRKDAPITARIVERNGKTWMQFFGYNNQSIPGMVFQGVRGAYPEMKFKAGAF